MAAAIITIGLGLVFAGSPDKLANGTRIAGIDVGGLTPANAQRLLEQRSERVSRVPVVFTVGTKRFSITPRQLGVEVDWAAAVANARKQGDGFGFVRGYRRLELEFFPQDLVPPIRAYDAALTYELELLSKAIDRPHQEARLVRRGLHITIAAGTTGRALDKQAAREVLVRSLASFSREAAVGLPVRVDAPRVTVATLTGAQRTASRIIAAPVTLLAGPTRLKVPRWRLAKLLDLSTMRFSGPAADAYFARLEQTVETPPKDADFAITAGGGVRIVPSRPGVGLDVPQSAARIFSAATRVQNRTATLVLAEQQPKRTTADAQAMGITGTVGSYETVYGGIANRIHNVQLVAHLVDHKFIAPGDTFSFNGTTGERSAAKGFLEAPVIVNGEVQTGLGGGVCQVSTTVFNAAYEAGLPITSRTNHALYISHYPLGRDATVDYPGIDLKFVNDTGHWLLLRTWVGSSSLTVGLYGTPQHRRVESTTAPLRVVSPPPVLKTVDATLNPGEVVVDSSGVPSQATSVERKVYDANGKLLSDATWYSSYRSEPKIVRVGPKKPKEKKQTVTTVTTTTDSAPTAPR
ncbi:MAG TPA: VanW family protein [Gaiellaceae bacterium]|nr:VanW family protein [Gaiellaceae bacterium]